MKLTWRELGKAELIEEGDLWIDGGLNPNVLQKAGSANRFVGIFAEKKELGRTYHEVKSDTYVVSVGWKCWRYTTAPSKPKIKEAAWNKPRNIDMTL